jgi:hypothetical protein
MGLVLLWTKALEGRPGHAAGLGLALFAATFFTYKLLVVGAPMLLYGLASLARRRWARDALVRALVAGALALATAAAAHVALAAATGYDPIRSFLRAAENERSFVDPPYLVCLGFDLYDFFLGAGMMTFPLVVLHLRRAWAGTGADRTAWRATAVGLASILVIDSTGLLQGETARLWMFLQPLVVVPAGLELARWAVAERAGVLGLQWAIVAIVKAKLWFLWP